MEQVHIVPNSPKYYEFIRLLRNDPRVASGFLEEGGITEAQQVEYMRKHSECYFVALVQGLPAGYAGVVDNDLRVCTHPQYQGRGIGHALVSHVLGVYPSASVRIKWGNEASMRLFSSLGFSPAVVLMERR
jgi:GNAT superfamily N-acetyltransferase